MACCMLTQGLDNHVINVGIQKKSKIRAPQGFILQPLLFPHLHTNTEFYLALADDDDPQFNSDAEMNKEKASTIFNIVSDDKLAL